MPSDLPATLLIGPEARVLLVNAPIGYGKKIAPLPTGATVTDKRGRADVVLVFVRDGGELRRLATSFGSLEEDAILWVCYPRRAGGRGSDLDRELLTAVMGTHELIASTEVTLDDAWEAMQFHAPDDAER